MSLSDSTEHLSHLKQTLSYQSNKSENSNAGLTILEISKTLEPIKEDDDDDHGGILMNQGPPDLSLSSIRHYASTRFSTLFQIHISSIHSLNPIPALSEMTASNWNYFFMGLIAWFSASFDFFLTSVAATQIAKSLNVSTSSITWGLSAVLMLRSCGALMFGLWTDSHSRKWPFITCCALFCILQIGTGFCNNFHQFLAVRALSGIAMGGTYGCSAATSLDDSPVKARSFLSGLFFTAYPFGAVFAAVFWRAFENTEKSWKALFWFSSGFPFIIIIWRLFYPETKFFERLLKAQEIIKQEQIEAGTYIKPTIRSRLEKFGRMVKHNWILFVYLILLLAYANFCTHATQDLYPTMLRQQAKLNENQVTIAVVVVNLGAVCGSLLVGTFMEVLGRRLSLFICLIIVGAFLYPAFMLQYFSAIIGGGFFLYFGVMGAWGVFSIHLSECSPPEARALVSGLAYQLGNLASSASSTIESRLANNWPIYNVNGEVITHDYAKVMTVLSGAVCIYGLVMVIVGPEFFHRNLSSPQMNKYIKLVIQRENEELGDNEKS
ncbi:hypothetical protein WICMUC_003290 [Wickerhamomyces mucosus]|uniref:Major facilitator superfamily (MFS) profile domain-containing protein n=1 Tax=Wickerhamomyces mucosus TaxID=1378264 RepID=A0A9P8PLP1_9ASCO|nr:hypothetical protein WICMUC_003290 [Wickerhamomyces mucosus]